MKNYTTPTADFIKFASDDIITTSVGIDLPFVEMGTGITAKMSNHSDTHTMGESDPLIKDNPDFGIAANQK